MNTQKIYPKLLASALLTFFLQTASAQNLVVNHSFENGTQLCTNGSNGPFWLNHGWVANWVGHNIQFPSQVYNTGRVFDNNATCTFGQFDFNMSALSGNRAINIALEYDGDFGGSQAIGSLSSALGFSCHSLSIMLSGYSGTGWPQSVDNVVQVLVRASGGGRPDKLVGEFTVSKTPGWKSYGNFFTVSLSDVGYYDKVVVRLKEITTQGNYRNGILIDDVAISPCGTWGGTLPANEPVTRATFSGGDIPFITGESMSTIDGDVLHGWQVAMSDELLDVASEDWAVLDAYTQTTTEPVYVSEELPSYDTYYRLTHTIITPFDVAACKSIVLYASDNMNSGSCTFVPDAEALSDMGYRIQQEENSTRQENAAQSSLGQIENETSLFQLSPNPADDQLTLKMIQKSEKASYVIFDSKGAEVMRKDHLTDENRIDISSLSGGVYYIHVSHGSETATQKFIKE